MPQAVTPVDQKLGIVPQLVARMVDVLHPVQIWLFGSRARGDARVEVFTRTRSELEEWNRSLGTLAEIVASTGIVVYGG